MKKLGSPASWRRASASVPQDPEQPAGYGHGHGNHRPDHDHHAEVDAQRRRHGQRPWSRRHHRMGDGASRRDCHEEQQVVPARPHAHCPRQRNEQIEHGVEEYRNRQHVPAAQERKGGVLLAERAHEHAHDLVGRPALHEALSYQRRQGDDDGDAAADSAELASHARHHVPERHVRGQDSNGRGGCDQRNERVDPKPEDEDEDDRDRDRENGKGVQGHRGHRA